MDSFSRDYLINASPEATFKALTSEIDKWWTPEADDASKVGQDATFKFGDGAWTMRVTEAVADKRVAWDVVKDTNTKEWVGTKPQFDLSADGGGTRVKFLHEGLVPSFDCYQDCEGGWDHFLGNSLKAYLETGTGMPFGE